VHHPIFKGKPVNYDPRERFIAVFMAKRGDYNIPGAGAGALRHRRFG
jgi:hypothetical protein